MARIGEPMCECFSGSGSRIHDDKFFSAQCSAKFDAMKIALVTPAAAQMRNGNRHTSQRWAKMLRELGHRVRVQLNWDGKPADLMLALHARRSYDSIKAFAEKYPDRPLIVALTGTDLYRDIRVDTNAKESMQLATRMIVLQEMGLNELSPKLAAKTRVIYQSTNTIAPQVPLKNCFEVSVIGHLREEKDPLRAARALKYLPDDSRIRVTQLGRSLDPLLTSEAKNCMSEDARYHWFGEVPHWKAARILARSRVMVISSRMEGGANVVSEALVAGVPVIASKISGNIGMLGKDYPGYFPVGDERALAKLLLRAERDTEFYRSLKAYCRERKKLISAAREKAALKHLIGEIS
jgi:putative glycosyltransferase (TIGR04348 family)